MTLAQHELKTLAIELAAAMPPPVTETTDEDIADALERLTNCECVLRLAIKEFDEQVVDAEQWHVSEALHGALKLLRGCYTTLSEAVGQP